MKFRNLYALILLIAAALIVILLVTMRTESKKILLTDRELITQSGVCQPFNLYDENGYVIDPVITNIAMIAGAYAWIRMKKDNLSGLLIGKLQAIFLILAVVSGILMMIKFGLIYRIVRVAYTVFDISVVLSVFISIVYFINDQFSILKAEAQK